MPRWADVVGRRERETIASKGLGLLDFCAQCETVELWVDPVPNAQLMLAWLLSCFSGHQAASKLRLVQANVVIGNREPHEIARWAPPAVTVSEPHFQIASLAWQAYRAPTPQPWFDLLARDLSALPRLRRGTELTNDRLWRRDPAPGRVDRALRHHSFRGDPNDPVCRDSGLASFEASGMTLRDGYSAACA